MYLGSACLERVFGSRRRRGRRLARCRRRLLGQTHALLGVLGTNRHVLERVATFLLPKDVARLEQTCRGFAAQPERNRRSSLSIPLLNLRSDEVLERIRIYCSEKLAVPRVALRSLIMSTHLWGHQTSGQQPRQQRVRIGGRDIVQIVTTLLG